MESYRSVNTKKTLGRATLVFKLATDIMYDKFHVKI